MGIDSGIDNDENLSNKPDGIDFLAQKYGLENDENFRKFFNNLLDEIFNDPTNKSIEMYKQNKNSINFYKLLYTNKLKFISGNIDDVLKKYKSNGGKLDSYDIDSLKYYLSGLFKEYYLFESDFYGYKNEPDIGNFLKSAFVNILYEDSTNNNNKYDDIHINFFIDVKRSDIKKLYNEINKSKSKSQNWEDFFINKGNDAIKEVQSLYDIYSESKIAKKKERESNESFEKWEEIIGILSKHSEGKYNDKFLGHLTSIFKEKLNDNTYLNETFLKSLFDSIPQNYAEIYKDKRKEYQDLILGDKINGNFYAGQQRLYVSEVSRVLTHHIKNAYSRYKKGKDINTLVIDADIINPTIDIPRKKCEDHEKQKKDQMMTNLESKFIDGLLYSTLPVVGGASSVGAFFTLGSRRGISNTPEKKDKQDIINNIKTQGNKFKEIKDELGKRGVFIADDHLAYAMLYACSISQPDYKKMDEEQIRRLNAMKPVAKKTLDENPTMNLIGKEIWENIIQNFTQIDSTFMTLNGKFSEGSHEFQRSDEEEQLNKLFYDIQEVLTRDRDIDAIKNYCNSIVSQIKSKEKDLNSEGFILEKLDYLIPSFFRLKNLTNEEYYNPRGLYILWRALIDQGQGIGDINNNTIDLKISETFGDKTHINGRPSDGYKKRKQNNDERKSQIDRRRAAFNKDVTEYNNTIIARYETAQSLAESKRFYDSDVIRGFFPSDSNPDDPSGLQVASKIDNINNKLNNYRIKTDRSEHEEAALKYTAFDITFNNTFNLSNNPIVQKLGHLNIDLRSEMSSYGFYNQESNTFNEDAWNKFVNEKLQNAGDSPEEKLTAEEIDNLKKSFEGLPAEVEKNYEVLCGNFETDQSSFEKIAKVYALGEIIDNIKSLFSGLDSKRIGDFMGLELDAKEPADIKGDCLFIKGTINGTETNIKYDLRTGKLYMNSFTEQTFNPPKIVIGNTEPTTEIGDLGSFEDTINNLNNPFVQENGDNEQSSEQSSEQASKQVQGEPSQDENSNEQGKESATGLIKKKLNEDLKKIGDIVNEKAGEQGKENNVIDELLKTFNILPDTSNSGESKSLEFMGGSKLFTLIESIKNTNDESELTEFSNQMKELMSLCELSWGKNNENPNQGDFTSISIFNIDENNATTDIISLQQASQRFFSQDFGEKDRIKDSESHFDSSIQLSFANIIVQKCCEDSGDGRKISANKLKSFVTSVKDGVSNIKSDNDEVLAMESMFEDDVSLA